MSIKASNLTELGPEELSVNDVFVVIDISAGTSGTKKISAGSLGLISKKYIALLSQSGENAPTATELLNGINSDPVFARYDVGVYTITATSKFPAGKTRIYAIDTTGFSAIVTHTDANTITVETFDSEGLPADSLLNGHLLEINSYLS